MGLPWHLSHNKVIRLLDGWRDSGGLDVRAADWVGDRDRTKQALSLSVNGILPTLLPKTVLLGEQGLAFTLARPDPTFRVLLGNALSPPQAMRADWADEAQGPPKPPQTPLEDTLTRLAHLYFDEKDDEWADPEDSPAASRRKAKYKDTGISAFRQEELDLASFDEALRTDTKSFDLLRKMVQSLAAAATKSLALAAHPSMRDFGSLEGEDLDMPSPPLCQLLVELMTASDSKEKKATQLAVTEWSGLGKKGQEVLRKHLIGSLRAWEGPDESEDADMGDGEAAPQKPSANKRTASQRSPEKAAPGPSSSAKKSAISLGFGSQAPGSGP
jgi:hypothetical protein